MLLKSIRDDNSLLQSLRIVRRGIKPPNWHLLSHLRSFVCESSDRIYSCSTCFPPATVATLCIDDQYDRTATMCTAVVVLGNANYTCRKTARRSNYTATGEDLWLNREDVRTCRTIPVFVCISLLWPFPRFSLPKGDYIFRERGQWAICVQAIFHSQNHLVINYS